MSSQNPQTLLINLDTIDIPADAREHDPEKLKSLAQDMKEQGQLQEIVVLKKGERVEVLAGQGRVLAARMLKWPQIRASVREGLSEFEKARITFAENEDREDADPIYQAAQIQKMVKNHQGTQQSLAQELGISDSLLSSYVVVDRMPPAVKAISRRLEMGKVTQIARLNDVKMQIRLAQKCLENDLSVRQLKAFVDHKVAKSTPAKPAVQPPKDPLAEIWRLALWNPTDVGKPTWGVSYGPQRLPGKPVSSTLAWHFWIGDPGKTQKTFLIGMFKKMIEMIGETDEEEKVSTKAAANWQPKSQAEAEEMLNDNNRARAPKTPAEESELKALAEKGPGPVYAWVFGAGGFYARRSKGLSWNDLGIKDAREGYKKIVEMARALEQFDPEKFNKEMNNAIGRAIDSAGRQKN